MSLCYVDAHPFFRLSYTLDGPLLKCQYSSWLLGSAETTVDLRAVSPYLGRASVRDYRMTRVFYAAGILAFAVGVLALDQVTHLLGDRLGLLLVGVVPLLLLLFAALNPFRIEIARVNGLDGRTLLDIRRSRKSSPAFDQLLAGIGAVLAASAEPTDAADSR